MKVNVLVAQSCLTLCDPMDCSLPGSSVHGILQARIMEWAAFPPPRDLPDSGIKPQSPALQGDSWWLSLYGLFNTNILGYPRITLVFKWSTFDLNCRKKQGQPVYFTTSSIKTTTPTSTQQWPILQPIVLLKHWQLGKKIDWFNAANLFIYLLR